MWILHLKITYLSYIDHYRMGTKASQVLMFFTHWDLRVISEASGRGNLSYSNDLVTILYMYKRSEKSGPYSLISF